MAEKNISLPLLSERLAAAVSFVTDGNRAVDVGCDHGYTAITLRNTGVSPFCICTDINKGPLEAAAANISRFHADGIEVRLGDGLASVRPGEAETLIITGMGGELICRILETGRDVAQTAEELVLGPQSEPEKVREKLIRIGFHIADEKFIFEDGKYYPVIKALRWSAAEPLCEIAVTGEPGGLSETELKYGPVLLREQSPGLQEFLVKERKRYETILVRLESQGVKTEENEKRKNEVRHELELIGQAQEYYKQ